LGTSFCDLPLAVDGTSSSVRTDTGIRARTSMDLVAPTPAVDAVVSGSTR
jgi:hypothetical protein